MKGLQGKYAAMYNFSYMSIGSLLPLIGQYLASIGFTGAQIGTVTASGTLVAIFASAFWGDRYSRSSRKYGILMLLCAVAALLCLALSTIRVYGFFLSIFAIMYFFQAPVMSLTDAFTVESGRSFGGLRAWGAVGFSLGTLLAGFWADRGGLSVIFWMYGASFLIAALCVFMIRRSEMLLGEPVRAPGGFAKRKGDGRGGYLRVLENKRLRRLIICAFFWGGTNVANNTYFSFLYLEGGGTVAGVGIAMFLMVGSEIPFMAWCERISRRLTMERLVLMSMTASVMRLLVFGMGVPWWALLMLSFTQGAVNGILLIEFVRYAARLAPEGLESLAISSYYVIGSNLSTICCQFVGGILLDLVGAHGVYLFFGLFNLCGIVMYLAFGLHRPEVT